jgi:hypothetical protein
VRDAAPHSVASAAIPAATLHSIPANRLVNHGIGATQLAAKVTRQKLPLINGWVDAAGAGAPFAAVQGGIAYLSGAISQPTGNGSLFAVLPKAARPAHDLYIPVVTDDGTTSELFITPSGEMAITSASPADAVALTSLDGVSFPVGS